MEYDPLVHRDVVAAEKGAFESPLTTVVNITCNNWNHLFVFKIMINIDLNS